MSVAVTFDSLDDAANVRRAFHAGPPAHIFDFVTAADQEVRNAIEAFEPNADIAPYIAQAVAQGAQALECGHGQFFFNSTAPLNDIVIRGVMRGEDRYLPGKGYAKRGTVFSPNLNPAHALPMIGLGRSVFIERVTFFDPLQIESPTAPLARPFMISHIDTNTPMIGCGMRGCVVVNPYNFFEAGGEGEYHKFGRIIIEGNHLFALNQLFRLNNGPDFFRIKDNLIGLTAYAEEVFHYAGAGHGHTGSYPLGEFATANHTIVTVWGNGSPTARSAKSVDGLSIVDNDIIGAACVLDVDKGTALGFTIGGNLDGTPRHVRVRAGGAATGKVRYDGCTHAVKLFSPATLVGPHAIEIENPAPNTDNTPMTKIHVDGPIAFSNGGFLKASGANVKAITVDVDVDFGRGSDLVGDLWAVDIDCPAARVKLRGALQAVFPSVSGGTVRKGARINAAADSDVEMSVVGCEKAVEHNATAGIHRVGGLSRGTTGSVSVTVASPALTRVNGRFDKPNTDIEIGAAKQAARIAASALALSSDVRANVTELLLQPGTWDVSGAVQFTGHASTLVGQMIGSVGVVSAQLDTSPDRNALCTGFGNPIFASMPRYSVQVGPTQFTVAVATTIYLVAQAGYVTGPSYPNAAMAVHGTLQARRC